MIRLENIVKKFPGVFKPVLDGIGLTLNSGDFCVVIGSNGSGKSTLLKIINGEYMPDSGTARISGKVAEVVQDVSRGAIPDMTLLENIVLSEMQYRPVKLTFYRRYRDEVLKKLQTLDMGLEEYLDQPLKCLSGGQRQAVATLMAINSRRPILLLDEHTSALDPKMQALLMEYTAGTITELGRTSIMVTHKMDDAIRYGNRLIMLHNGKIVLDMEGNDKSTLKVQDLLSLFHKYEDQTLVSGGEDDD